MPREKNYSGVLLAEPDSWTKPAVPKKLRSDCEEITYIILRRTATDSFSRSVVITPESYGERPQKLHLAGNDKCGGLCLGR